MFYERFCALCKVRGKAPTAVLDEVGLSKMNSTLWKKGAMPSYASLQKLAEYFNVPTDYLTGTYETITFTFDSSPEQRETITEAEIEKEMILLRNLIEEVNTIPKNRKAEAIRDIKTLVQYVLDKYKTMVPEDSFIGP